MQWFTSWIIIGLFLSLTGCTRTRPFIAPQAHGWNQDVAPPDSLRAFQVYLIGDIGEPSPDTGEPVLRLLTSKLDAAGPQSAVVFLGDNLYPRGLVNNEDASRPEAERRLLKILTTVRDFEGRIVFIPGNHDWDFRHSNGVEAVRRQEDFIEQHLGRGNVFLPDRGFPGPVEVPLTDDLTLVVLDTQWWLHDGDRPFGDNEDYELEAPADFLVQLEDVVWRHRNRHLLVVGHHPVFSNGTHAGYHPLRHHLFPLTAKVKWAYVPLPVVGSFYVAYSRFIGGNQEFAGWRYVQLRRGLFQIFPQHEHLIYAAGHDHALAYFRKKHQHYLVSGSGSKVDYVAPGHGATFAASERGFMQLDYYTDGQVWLSVWSPVGDGSTGVVLFRSQLERGRSVVPLVPPETISTR